MVRPVCKSLNVNQSTVIQAAMEMSQTVAMDDHVCGIVSLNQGKVVTAKAK